MFVKARFGGVSMSLAMLFAAVLGVQAVSDSKVMAQSDEIEFNRDVRPIVSNRCFTCHGPDGATREAGLRLDLRESATSPADSGEIAITPGDVDASELIRRVVSDDEGERMPPEGKPLSEREVEVLRKWIEQGAQYQSHWAFEPPRKVVVPDSDGSGWPRNDIDRFVLRRLKRSGMQPAREASRETIIRRVAYDLTGLPPTLEEIDQYLLDSSPDAHEKMVDRYFDSPAYGEHMARHWLDLARYADTNGYQYDTEREQWVWRDWVIDAYNRNMPFDQFTIEQLAGDLLPDATDKQQLATGFNRNHGITIEGGIIDEEYRVEYVMDRLVTTGEVWMGLTVGCARCHEHKFDPISQREFYQMYAFFNQVPERGMRGFAPQKRIPSPLAGERVTQLENELASLRAELANADDVQPQLDAWIRRVADSNAPGWRVLHPLTTKSSGGSIFTQLDDDSLLVGGANPRQDIYEIGARSDLTNMTAVRLEALTHESLPGGGPGRHSNSNFVLSEFELTAVSVADPSKTKRIRFVRAIAEYSQNNYEIAKAIDDTVSGNNGWAVDGPTRKKPVSAIFIADAPFGFDGGTELRFRLRHEAGFATHGIGRVRLSTTRQSSSELSFGGIPEDIVRAAARPAEKRDATEQKKLRDYFLSHYDPHQKLRDRIASAEKQKLDSFPPTMIMQDAPKSRATFVLNRGQYNDPGEQVEAGVPEVFPPMPDGSAGNRLGLAQWLVDPSHPLTARVAVNRYWQRLFGIGLVKTSEDFGVQGELPSHPELLDWLALDFVRSGWDVKRIQRLIVNSATYRQSSHVGALAYRSDPENRMLGRGPRMRLDGEEIRDMALSTSGLLKNALGGRSVFPYQPKGLWMELNNRPGYSKAYQRGQGNDLYRRSMYTFWKRTVPSPMMKTFDAPEREFCTIRRSRTNTPLQALLLLNGPQFVEAARHLGERMMREGGSTIDDRVRYGFRLVTARLPTSTELNVLREVVEQENKRFQKSDSTAARLLEVGDSEFDVEVDAAELAAYAELARLLLNLNEAITKG